MNKIFTVRNALIAGGAIIVLVGAYIYFVQKSAGVPVVEKPDEAESPVIAEKMDVSKWKIYRNEKYGFEVRYPKEWFGGEISPFTNYALFKKELQTDAMTSIFSIQIFNNEKLLSPQNWWRERDKKDGVNYIFEGEIKLDEDFIGYKYREKEGLDTVHVIFAKNSFIFLISRIGFNDELFNKFLNSFNFYK